uniref:Neurotransmitter-gated ion-channel transmembrane domain-containing protein n=1 Tax=Strigamia maritima TaxID=126957 RepID=T1J803_STRMM
MSPKTMDMKIETAFYLSWRDFRLNATVLKKETTPYTVFPEKLSSEMWFPLLNFGNCKACSSIRNQPITVNYTIGQPDVNTINVPPELELLEMTTTDCLESTDSDVHNSCNYYNFIMIRSRARPILLVLIPSIIIVIISWISFWLEPSNAAPRVALGLTSMLTLATQFSSAQRDLPAVSTLMALDVWMFSCILIVFISLIEYAIVGFLEHLDRSNTVSPVKTPFSTPSITNLEMKYSNKSKCRHCALSKSYFLIILYKLMTTVDCINSHLCSSGHKQQQYFAMQCGIACRHGCLLRGIRRAYYYHHTDQKIDEEIVESCSTLRVMPGTRVCFEYETPHLQHYQLHSYWT